MKGLEDRFQADRGFWSQPEFSARSVRSGEGGDSRTLAPVEQRQIFSFVRRSSFEPLLQRISRRHGLFLEGVCWY